MKIRALIVLGVLAAAPLTASDHPGADGSREVVIPEGTRVELRLEQTVSSASAEPYETIRFEAADDVVVDGVKVIEKGAEGLGTILVARPRKGFGRRGKLDFSIDTVRAVNGHDILLRSAKSLRGQDRYNKAGIVTLLTGPFGILVKGKNVEVPMGTVYTVFIEGDRKVTLKKEQVSWQSSTPAG